jgi:hypothetical protein
MNVPSSGIQLLLVKLVTLDVGWPEYYFCEGYRVNDGVKRCRVISRPR